MFIITHKSSSLTCSTVLACTMFQCYVCHMRYAFATDLHNHMHRHLKTDLISAVYKLLPDSEDTLMAFDMEERKDSKETSEDIDIDMEPTDIKTEMNNNLKQAEKMVKLKRPQRRSCRLKDKIDQLKDQMNDNIDDSYYIPADDERRAAKFAVMFSDDSEEDVRPLRRAKGKKAVKGESRKKNRVEPVFLTPKVEKEPSSETDSCSGNALSESSAERLFCTYCGSGYRTQSSLADHIRHNHFNHCNICDMNFTDSRLFREHQQRHAASVKTLYICGYCSEDCMSREVVAQHTDRHLQNMVIDDVLSLEERYFSERASMNTMYNMFNAGYMYGKRIAASGGHDGTSSTGSHLPTEFYQVFLQYAAGDVENVEHYGYLCRTCGYTLFDRTHYRDHMQIAHGVTASDVELLLSNI